MADVELTRDGDRYLISVDGREVGEVYKSRMNGTRRNVASAGPYFNQGRTVWAASSLVELTMRLEDEYPTRKEAVHDLVTHLA